ncbi:Lrp/AsnC family transcriptional regulator [Aestuariispira insulae]|uniref:AsnC family transcriptional regulator n=1 Tax=Aestuariispira insulae TaxID=1461337 RepID=A0A3D9H9K6_9PROT|nr:Lrp/AsnC family transcriptional regulator [Aestuariispira insulae]RED46173.1 AsnC family transcriptional regulator [Aestuariispira insulae]
MDEFDRKLLNQMQINNRQTAEILSEKVGLSPAACQKRLKKLRETGVIASDISVLDPASIGRRMTMIVEVTMERERPEYLDEFKRKMRASPEVMQCYYVTGTADFVLIVTAKDMKDYEEFTRNFFFQNSNVRRFQTNVVMDGVKVGLAVPLSGDGEG